MTSIELVLMIITKIITTFLYSPYEIGKQIGGWHRLIKSPNYSTNMASIVLNIEDYHKKYDYEHKSV